MRQLAYTPCQRFGRKCLKNTYAIRPHQENSMPQSMVVFHNDWSYFPRRFQTAKNRDVSTGPLAFPFAHHVHSFDCSALFASHAHSTRHTCLLAHALRCAHCLTHSLTQSLPSLTKNVIFCESGCSEPKCIQDVCSVYRQASLQMGR